MKNYIIWAGIIAVAGILVWQWPAQSSPQPVASVASVLSVQEPFYDFGDIDIYGGKVHTTYTLTNEGTEDVSIVSAVTSCICTTGQIDDLVFGMHENSGKTIVIRPGEEKTLTATFDPLAHGPNGVGKIRREVSLTTNSTATPEVKVTFVANVVKK